MPPEFIEDTQSLEKQIFGEDKIDEETEERDSEEDDLDSYESLEKELERLPSSAKEVASFENDIDHSPGLSWHSEFSLYLTPLYELSGGYALLVLDWDDNWGWWEWRIEAALTGAVSAAVAEKALLERYCAKYLPASNGAFRRFLERLL